MVAIDDSFVGAKIAQESLMDTFTIVDEEAAIKHWHDFEASFFRFKSGITSQTLNSNWDKRIVEKLYGIYLRIFIPIKTVKHLRRFETSFSQYENSFGEWKTKEENRLMELESYLSNGDIALTPEQVARLLEISDLIKEMTGKLVPKFFGIVERLKDTSDQFEDCSKDATNRIADLATRMERSFEEHIESLLDFSYYYRGLARAFDPSNTRSEVFDDAESMIRYLNAG